MRILKDCKNNFRSYGLLTPLTDTDQETGNGFPGKSENSNLSV